MNDLKQQNESQLAILLLRAAKFLDEPGLNSSLCLIFNGMASMIAIVFIVIFMIGNREPLLLLGVLGCTAMTLANITDLFPFWLRKMAKAATKKN
ncbi:hypothetical protein Q5O14_14080 [Eubacteriaceae bacterium ES2]|nr:hypothetical protein Q5O14_14080 [Eubacteriaceae bacterium ES2]